MSAFAAHPGKPERIEIWKHEKVLSPWEKLKEISQACTKDASSDEDVMAGFEKEIAALFGKEDAMFAMDNSQCVVSALAQHTRGKHKIVALHPQSAVAREMPESLNVVLQMSSCFTGKKNVAPNYGDIASAIKSYWRCPGAIVVELTSKVFGGECIPWQDLEYLRQLADEKDIKIHLDGTFIWEAQPFYRKSFRDLCALFDSVHISFTHGMGALAGSILVGDRHFISNCRKWRGRFGGNAKSFLPSVIDCKAKFAARNHLFSKFVYHMNSISTQVMIKLPGNRTFRLEPLCPQTNMVSIVFNCTPAQLLKARDMLLAETNYDVFEQIYSSNDETTTVQLTIGTLNLGLSEGIFADALAQLVGFLPKAIEAVPKEVSKQVTADMIKSDKELLEERMKEEEEEERVYQEAVRQKKIAMGKLPAEEPAGAKKDEKKEKENIQNPKGPAKKGESKPYMQR